MESRSPAVTLPPYCRAMSELQVEPQVLGDAARAVAADLRTVEQLAAAVEPALDAVATAVPGSRTAAAAQGTGDVLSAAVRALAAELAVLTAALGAAAKEYVAVERDATAGLERAGRGPV